VPRALSPLKGQERAGEKDEGREEKREIYNSKDRRSGEGGT